MSIYNEEHSLLARIAWMYYIQGLTQEQIGKKLLFSRTKITRLLAKAREARIVEITINSNFRSCLDTEEQLRKRFALKEVIVVPTGNTIDETREGVGKACARYLEKTLVDGDILGCAWGRSLYYAGKELRSFHYTDLTVVQLMGGLNVSAKINPQEILELIASKLHASGVWLNTPAVVGTPEIKEALLSDEGVRKALEQGKQCTKALLGLGDMSPQASLVVCNALSIKEIEELKALGAVGDMLAWFFDITGNLVEHPIMERVISTPIEAINDIPLRIAGTAGRDKARVILGAIRGGYINALITDEQTALEVLRICNSGG